MKRYAVLSVLAILVGLIGVQTSVRAQNLTFTDQTGYTGLLRGIPEYLAGIVGSVYLRPSTIAGTGTSDLLKMGWDQGLGYCVDLDHTTSNGVVDLSYEVETQAALLYDWYAAGAKGDPYKEASLQIAIWASLPDIKTTSSTDVIGDRLTIDGSSWRNWGSGTAADWFDATKDSSLWDSAKVIYIVPENQTEHVGQAYITGYVPEPGSLALLLPGLAPAGMLIRRRRKIR